MLQTLRTCRHLRRQGIKEWPWDNPIDTLHYWKGDYKYFGQRRFFQRKMNKIWDFLQWNLYLRHSQEMKREMRKVYLGSRIFALESLIRYYGEKAKE